MTAFDFDEVTKFTADLLDRVERCGHGEGMECATLDGALMHTAKLCWDYLEAVRAWGQAVFTGKIAFDAAIEAAWKERGEKLYAQAVGIDLQAGRAEAPCYQLDGQRGLKSSLWDLRKFFNPWVTPKLAVGPAARLGLHLSPEADAEMRRRIAALPPLPADWEPTDPVLKARFRRATGK